MLDFWNLWVERTIELFEMLMSMEGSMKMVTVVIVVEGGNVQEILTDDSSVQVCLIDYDNEPDFQPPAYLRSFQQAKVANIGGTVGST